MGEHTTPNRLAVDQPTRGADRNRSLADQADPAADEMLLPALGDGITLLDVEGGRGVPILQSLVLDHLLLHDGPAFWVDANGHATTTTLAQIAPSQRLLNRIHVAHGVNWCRLNRGSPCHSIASDRASWVRAYSTSVSTYEANGGH